MDDAIEELCKKVEQLEGPVLFVRTEEIEELLAKARSLRQSEPETSLKLMTVLAFKLLGYPQWTEGKRTILGETINLIEELGGQDYVFAWKFADFCKAEAQYVGAGYNYKRAAEASERKGISFLKPDPPYLDRTQFFRLLREATVCFQMGGETALARECYLETKTKEMEGAKGQEQLIMKFGCFLWNWGESPLKVVRFSAIVILIYAVGFLIAGIRDSDEQISTSLLDCIYFSTITFSTVGYGDLSPSALPSRLMAASEGLMGIFSTGLFLVTFVKRFAR